MGLPRGDERVRGGRAFKGGGAPRLGLGPEAALKVMAHSGPRAGGGHRRGLWVKGAGDADTGSAPTGSPTGAGIPFKRRVHQKETCQACVQVASTLRTSFKFCLDSES